MRPITPQLVGAYILVLPHGARMPYQGRQMLPFVALLVGGVAGAVVESYRALGRPNGDPAAPGAFRTAFEAPWVLVSIVALFVTSIFFGFASRRPVYQLDRFGADVSLAKSLSTFRTAREPVFLDLDGFQVFWNPAYEPGYPQIMPLLEYYAGSRARSCASTRSGGS